jgi:ribosomal protein S18 acetylase RimI-like enzyme
MIAKLTTANLPEVLRLEAECFPHERWSQQVWEDEFAVANVLGYWDEDLLGLASFAIAGATVDLRTVGVTAAARRRGVATELLRTGMEWAAAMGASRMLLEVAEGNAPALELYRKLGFGLISRRRRYYRDGADALILEVAL